MERALSLTEGVVQALVAIGAVVSGIMLEAAPDGRLLGMPADTLEGSPFATFVIPGIILLVVNGLGNAVSAVPCFRMRALAPSPRHSFPLYSAHA